MIYISQNSSKNVVPVIQETTNTISSIDQRQLTVKMDELTRTIAELKHESGNLDEIVTNQPWLKLFRQPGSSIKSLKVTLASNEDTSVTVTDRGLLQAFSGELVIRRELFGLNPGGSYNSDILPCNYQVILENDESYGISVPARGVLTFDQLANHAFETNPYLHQLCNALVKRPTFLPDQTLLAKMADSGMLITESDGTIYFSENRIQEVIYALLRAQIIVVPRPLDAGDSVESLFFYSFGDKITMKLFNAHIQIVSGDEEVWYKVDSDVPLQLRSVLTAG